MDDNEIKREQCKELGDIAIDREKWRKGKQ